MKLRALPSTIAGYHDDNNIVKIKQLKVTVPAFLDMIFNKINLILYLLSEYGF